MTTMNEKILFVDDEPNILSGLRRQLRNKFEYDCAVGPQEALSYIQNGNCYSVIVSDMRMPEMDGITFLGESKKRLPNAVHILLTGNADQGTAVRAINEGRVFRFVSKPCETDFLIQTVEQAIAQYRLVTAEKELLHKTLGGAIRVLTEVLNGVDPQINTRLNKMRDFAKQFYSILEIHNHWEVELAILLSDIGTSLLPSELVLKMKRDMALSEAERVMVKKIPENSAALIMNIPRLEGVGQIIKYSEKQFDGKGAPDDDVAGEGIPKGSRLIKILRAASRLKTGFSLASFRELRQKPQTFDVEIVDAILSHLHEEAEESVPSQSVSIKLRQLTVGQRVMKDIQLKDGRLLVKKGVVLSDAAVQQVKNYSTLLGVEEPIEVDVLIPSTNIEVRS